MNETASTVPLPERTIGGLHDFLERAVQDLPRGTPVLDLGCGSGAWLARLSRLGFTQLHGVDAGAAPGVAGIHFERRNLDHENPDLGERFGLITAIEVIEHLENTGRLLAFVARHLRNDGVALITTPNVHSLTCRCRLLLTGRLASFDAKGDPTHIAPQFLPCFEKTASRHGLAIADAWSYPPRGSLIFGRAVRMLAAVLRTGIADPLPGDTLCLRIRRTASALPAHPADGG